MRKKINFFCVIFVFLFSLNANAFWTETSAHLQQIFSQGQNEIYVPVNTWHNRWTYDDRVHKYNERPWGIGFGRSLSEDSYRYSLGFMEFQDSHNKVEPIFAYKWQKVWRADKTIHPTLGCMAGITMRDDYSYIPFPLVLPVFGFDIGSFSFENTYIPFLGKNNGNVLFTWIQWRF